MTMKTVTREMILAGHEAIKDQEFMLSWKLMEKIYLAMDALSDPTESPGTSNTPIRELELPIRAEHCLRYEDITTIERLVMCSEKRILKIPNMGKKSLNDIKDALARRGLHLKG